MELRKTIAAAICKSGKFETGQGTCAVICMDHLGCARNSCGHAERVHGKLADQIAAAIDDEIDRLTRIIATLSEQVDDLCAR